MQRILIIGCSGSGKSTLAQHLGSHLNIHVHHLDHVIWRPGWIQQDTNIIAHAVHSLCQQPQWIIDGTYTKTLAERIQYADTIIFLDFARWRCVLRVLKRYVVYRWNAIEMAPGCPATLNKNFLRYLCDFNKKFRPQIISLLQTETARNKKIYVLSSSGSVSDFLHKIYACGEAGSD